MVLYNQPDFKILLAGAGNLAWHLGPALQMAGYEVVQVYSRTMASAQKLGERMGISFTDDLADLSQEAGMVLLAVADDAIASVLESLPRQYPCIVHTAGSIPADILRGFISHYGVLYPLMTFTRERQLDMGIVPFCIESGDPETEEKLVDMADKISGIVHRIPFEDRKKLHMAAVIATNFSNHMYRLAEDYLRSEGLDFGMLKPVIGETAGKVMDISPAAAQTGPARRGDEKIIDAHLALLAGKPELQKIYTFVSDSIRRKYLSKE